MAQQIAITLKVVVSVDPEAYEMAYGDRYGTTPKEHASFKREVATYVEGLVQGGAPDDSGVKQARAYVMADRTAKR